MSNVVKPFIPASDNIRELTLRSVIIAIFLTIILAMSNAYLALKIGILTSASIPAAILSMGILHFFKNSTILENNCVQTAASAGEAVAGGIVYTIPALIIIQYWHHFDYWQNFFIAAIGGVLGVVFSIPLRQILVKEESLRFPEGRAIAEVLKTSSRSTVGLSQIILGGGLGASIELLQNGFKIIASSWSVWFATQRFVWGMGFGFSATLLGAGYLVGFEVALSIGIGAAIAWLFGVPIASSFEPSMHLVNANLFVGQLWDETIRYIGIGAMLFAGIWSFVLLLKPLLKGLSLSARAFSGGSHRLNPIRTEQDLPLPYLMLITFFMSAILFLFLQFCLPTLQAGISDSLAPSFIFLCVLYVLVIGLIFSAITGYFSGMVGVSASPGSSIIIAGMILAAFLLLNLLNFTVGHALSEEQIKAAEAITIVIGAVVTGIAAIANDNVQDLKVGHIIGATPWKQQLMLLLGVVVSALVIPPIMQLLYDVYGIAGIMPHDGMDAAQSLPAPPAAMMAAITQAVFHQNVPWSLLGLGAGIAIFMIGINYYIKRKCRLVLSLLGMAIGMYLPITSSFPLFFGGMLAHVVNRRLESQNNEQVVHLKKKQRGVLLACGLVAGAAIMDVLLAIPFSILRSPDALSLVGNGWAPMDLILAVFTVVGFCYLFHRTVLD